MTTQYLSKHVNVMIFPHQSSPLRSIYTLLPEHIYTLLTGRLFDLVGTGLLHKGVSLSYTIESTYRSMCFVVSHSLSQDMEETQIHCQLYRVE